MKLPPPPMPALLNTRWTWSVAYWSSTSSRNRSTASASATLHTCVVTRAPPAARAAVSASPASFRSHAATAHPAAASWTTSSRPIPLPPPVTTASFPSNDSTCASSRPTRDVYRVTAGPRRAPVAFRSARSPDSGADAHDGASPTRPRAGHDRPAAARPDRLRGHDAGAHAEPRPPGGVGRDLRHHLQRVDDLRSGPDLVDDRAARPPGPVPRALRPRPRVLHRAARPGGGGLRDGADRQDALHAHAVGPRLRAHAGRGAPRRVQRRSHDPARARPLPRLAAGAGAARLAPRRAGRRLPVPTRPGDPPDVLGGARGDDVPARPRRRPAAVPRGG